MRRQDAESETLIPTNGGGFVDGPTHALTGEGFDASEDGTGRGTPLVPIAFDTTQITSVANRSSPKAGDPCHPLAKAQHPPTIAFSAKDYGGDAQHELSPTLRAGTHAGSHSNAGVMPAIAFQGAGRNNAGSASGCAHMSLQGMLVRRLTPRECERLQGFPDDYTAITVRGKPAADGPRYKSLGNSWAVPVVRWIGRRIELVDAVAMELAA